MNKKEKIKSIKNNNPTKLPVFTLCSGECCRDCRYIEMDNDHYGDGTRRCAFKGEWVRPGSPACSRFEP